MSIILIIVGNSYSYYATPGTGKKWNLDSLVANSSGHITFSGGAYLINDTLTISQSDTIFIRTNSLIYMGFKSLINVNPNAVLIINPPDSVKFTVLDTASKFIGFVIDTSNPTILKKMIMEYGNSVSLLYSNILIDSCTFRFNNYYTTSLKSGAISLFYSNATISNCKIIRNRRAGIVSGGNIPSSPVITNNIFLENDTENGLYPQINLGVGSTTPITIRNNTIRGLFTNAGGIAIFPASTSMTSLIIENNIIKKNSYGMVLYNANINAYINNNIIDSNNINVNPMAAGSGINLFGASSINAIITRNKIRWNLWGITIQSSAKPDIGNLFNTDTSDNGYNQICFNKHNDTTFDVYNNTHDSISAQNNFWGTLNPDTVRAHIWDHYDIDSLGVINFLPMLLTEVKQVSTESVTDYKLFNAYPNPFNPSTNIRFQIPNSENGKWKMENGFVSLKVYDVTGKEVSTLVSGFLNPGIYEVQFPGKQKSNFQLPSGVYFYKLEAGNFTSTKKLMLIK
jgi:hypothetical protein